jgi:hypothetical protein
MYRSYSTFYKLYTTNAKCREELYKSKRCDLFISKEELPDIKMSNANITLSMLGMKGLSVPDEGYFRNTS